MLAEDLRGHLARHDGVSTELSAFGQKFEVRGSIEGATGRAAVLVAVWIVLSTEDFPAS